MADKVVFANEDVTLHKLVSESTGVTGDKYESVEGVNLLPGETFPLDELASYQKKAVEEGKVPAVELVSEDEAKKKTAEVEKIRAAVAGGRAQTVVAVDPHTEAHSDHEVSFEERAANHAARGEEEAGTGDAGSDPEVSTEPNAVKTEKGKAKTENKSE